MAGRQIISIGINREKRRERERAYWQEPHRQQLHHRIAAVVHRRRTTTTKLQQLVINLRASLPPPLPSPINYRNKSLEGSSSFTMRPPRAQGLQSQFKRVLVQNRELAAFVTHLSSFLSHFLRVLFGKEATESR